MVQTDGKCKHEPESFWLLLMVSLFDGHYSSLISIMVVLSNSESQIFDFYYSHMSGPGVVGRLTWYWYVSNI